MVSRWNAFMVKQEQDASCLRGTHNLLQLRLKIRLRLVVLWSCLWTLKGTDERTALMTGELSKKCSCIASAVKFNYTFTFFLMLSQISKSHEGSLLFPTAWIQWMNGNKKWIPTFMNTDDLKAMQPLISFSLRLHLWTSHYHFDLITLFFFSFFY